MQEEFTHAQGRLLLHSCCAPCSSYCLQETAAVFSVTVFYYNPNIDSRGEYEKRKAEQIRFLTETGLGDFLIAIICPRNSKRRLRGWKTNRKGGNAVRNVSVYGWKKPHGRQKRAATIILRQR